MARSSDISKNGREAASVEEPLKERDQGSGGRAGRLPVAQNLATPRASTRPLVRARSSAGEHYVDIVGVTGSIPVAPTIAVPRVTFAWRQAIFQITRSLLPA